MCKRKSVDDLSYLHACIHTGDAQYSNVNDKNAHLKIGAKEVQPR